MGKCFSKLWIRRWHNYEEIEDVYGDDMDFEKHIMLINALNRMVRKEEHTNGCRKHGKNLWPYMPNKKITIMNSFECFEIIYVFIPFDLV